MFGIMTYVKLGVVLAVISAAGLGYVFITNLQNKVIEQTKTIALQEDALVENQRTIQRQEEQQKVNEELRRDLDNRLQQATSNVSDLRKKLSNHDLTRLAINKPDSIERIINDASNKVLNDLEQLTSP